MLFSLKYSTTFGEEPYFIFYELSNLFVVLESSIEKYCFFWNNIALYVIKINNAILMLYFIIAKQYITIQKIRGWL
jgi:hypothetical protein